MSRKYFKAIQYKTIYVYILFSIIVDIFYFVILRILFFYNYTLPDKHTEISSTLCAFMASIIFFKPWDNIVVGPKSKIK